jgi:hypothetical protein
MNEKLSENLRNTIGVKDNYFTLLEKFESDLLSSGYIKNTSAEEYKKLFKLILNRQIDFSKFDLDKDVDAFIYFETSLQMDYSIYQQYLTFKDIPFLGSNEVWKERILLFQDNNINDFKNEKSVMDFIDSYNKTCFQEYIEIRYPIFVGISRLLIRQRDNE